MLCGSGRVVELVFLALSGWRASTRDSRGSRLRLVGSTGEVVVAGISLVLSVGVVCLLLLLLFVRRSFIHVPS